ncbi:MAG: YncE family protein [Burkholderiales bacterium]|nr:YncE family protein [Burkholderiales bacterium]
MDSIGDVGLSSVVRKGADGLPVIAYLQRIPGGGQNLKVAKCSDAGCSATSSIRVVVAETVSSLGDMQVDQVGRPTLVFREGALNRFLRCGDSACISGNTVTTLNSPFASVAGGWLGTRIAFGTGGRVYIVGPYGTGVGPLFFSVGLMICNDADCGSSNFVPVPDSAGESDIAIGANGLPVIASGGRTNSLNGHTLPLSVIRCSSASCDSFGQVRELLPAGPMYQSIRMVLAQDDAPIIALSGTSVARCLDSTCSTGASVNVVAPGYDPIELLLSAAGLPLIVLHEGSGGNALGIARCGNLACSESSIYTRIELPQHSGASASLGGDAKLIMTYFAEGPADLIALRCDSADCQDESAASSPGQSGAHPQVGKLLAVVPDFDGSSIHLIDVRSKSVVSTFPAEPGPIGVAISQSGQRAYVSNYGGQTVSYVDLVSRQIERSVSLTSGAPVGPRGIVVTPDDARLFVANSDQGAVAVIERASGSVIKSIPVGTLPFGLAINPQGTKVVVTNTNSGTVNVVDVLTATSLGAINVGAQPYGVAISPDGKTAYVASFGTDKLAVVNLETMSVSTTIPVGIGPFGVALSPNGAWAYVSDNVNQVSVVDLSLPATVASITVGLHPQGLAVTPDGRWLYVANQDGGTLSVVDVATRVVTTTLSGGEGPVSLGAFIASAPFVEALAIEYLHQPFGHYFMTAAPNEIALLDQGFFSGWSRTGQQWKVWSAAEGLNDVCRFFTVAFAPKSSHFYTAYPHECSLVKANPDWQYEQIAFLVALPVAGSCHVGVPLFRLYNSGQSGAPNHRYTLSATIRDQMVAQGFVYEGIAGCVPQ